MPAAIKTVIAKLVEARKEIRRQEIARRKFFKMFSIQEVNPAEFYHLHSLAFLLPRSLAPGLTVVGPLDPHRRMMISASISIPQEALP
jgi:hypothetical protein